MIYIIIVEVHGLLVISSYRVMIISNYFEHFRLVSSQNLVEFELYFIIY